MRELEAAQRAHQKCAARRPVGVEVADHQYAARAPVRGQELRGSLHALERAHRQQPLER